MKKLKVVCFGEVLWDVFSTYKKVGGAPLNVAIRLKSFGNEVSIISCIGKDALGMELLEIFKENKLDFSNVQLASDLKTGVVQVSLSKEGSASYEIMFPSAWDYIKYNDACKNLVANSDIFIFGSLAARNDTSRSSLLSLLEYANFKVFDINLRAPHYTQDLLNELMGRADFIKLNDEELIEIINNLGLDSTSIEDSIKRLSNHTKTSSICVTLGDKGAVLYYSDKFYYNKGYKVSVIDTVGSGDSFLATLINSIKKNESPQKAIDHACAVGAMVAQSEGANPVITNDGIRKFISSKIK
ncbi:carbohydrate kinase [Hanstruepera neustonica]|uniref:Carbohydrate kinase n=1 Tax=Hanstruepera neustonica TaxID=1445657 RepID=A0A2K1E170_9FLAO|nr:carbohydrate kinase [Hanstruepera neustonica]PNQ74018.1 carbohydrate kinase [Hanstruepera neustonica]